jgi:membrane protein DedA with SNARE-associated domain
VIDHASFLAWAAQQDPITGYAVLASATFLEYLIPILPSELIPTLLAIVNAAAERPVVPLILAGAVGSTLGGMLDYAVGRYMVSTVHDTWLHRLFRRPAVVHWVETLSARFERHGTWFILLNRFLPPIRQVLFVVAGTSKLPVGRVTAAAFTSALLWMLAVVGLGAALGFQLEHALVWFNRYMMFMTALVSLFVLTWLVQLRRENVFVKRDTEQEKTPS